MCKETLKKVIKTCVEYDCIGNHESRSKVTKIAFTQTIKNTQERFDIPLETFRVFFLYWF